jgi:hypothetical protein
MKGCEYEQGRMISKPPHSAALPPVRRLLSTAYHRTCDTLVAKWWLDGRGRPKTVIGVALDNPVVAKFQFQLPPVFFCLAQFLDPYLYLLYCVKHGTIEDLNIAFSGDVRLCRQCVWNPRRERHCKSLF